jgi:hypothetical protein
MTETASVPAEPISWERLFALPVTDPREVPASLAAAWDEIAARNPWVRTACDPPFEGAKVRICRDRGELARWLEFGNWCNGSAFAVEQGGQVLCFIQQGECTDEWMAVKAVPTTFKGRAAWMIADFESISWHYILTRKRGGSRPLFDSYLDDMFAASLEECRALAYRGAALRAQAPGFTPSYQPWRHGGWYVTNVRYPGGAVGCVSRNYSDRKWRIVCENTGPGAEGDRVFPTRDAAARAEWVRAQTMRLAESVA